MSTRMHDWRPGGRISAREASSLAERVFQQGDASAVRRFTQAFGARAGIGAGPLTDFVLAVSEAAACATALGPCTARVRLWLAGSRAFCEVRGNGVAMRRSASGAPFAPRRGEEESLRRWVLRQVSDYVSVVADPDGVSVLLSMTVA